MGGAVGGATRTQVGGAVGGLELQGVVEVGL